MHTPVFLIGQSFVSKQAGTLNVIFETFFSLVSISHSICTQCSKWTCLPSVSSVPEKYEKGNLYEGATTVHLFRRRLRIIRLTHR